MAHDHLWAGVDLKLENASFHLEEMGRSLQPLERTGYLVATQASGAIIGKDWQRPLYAHLDGFLSATRSVGQIIKCAFGVDKDARLKPWGTVPQEEQVRREAFQDQFNPQLHAFNGRLLSTSRHMSEHRSGAPPVTVTTTGLFGVVYTGSPTKPIPSAETRNIDLPNVAPMIASLHPIVPSWQDFKIDGQDLFSSCREHLQAASALAAEARRIAAEVHAGRELTPRW
jgi:hypothetical protein